MQAYLDVIAHRIVEDLLSRDPAISAEEISGFVRTLTDEGSWPDVDYRDGQLGEDACQHLRRTFSMVLAWRKPGHSLYQDGALFKGIACAVSFWIHRDVQARNIFFHGHEYQNQLGDILLLMRDALAPECLLAAKLLMERAWNTKGHWTGHNLVWRCEATVKRCVLFREPDLLDEAVRRMKAEQLKITTEEGIQCDFSFHQHGSQLHNGAYGLGFQEDMPWWIGLLEGTPWAFSKADIHLLGNLILEGTQWMTRGAWLDYACIGRQAGSARSHTRGLAVARLCQRMRRFDPERYDAYRDCIDAIEGRKTLYGNRAFWRSDFMAHHRAKFCASVKMHSQRVVGFEIVPESPWGKRDFHRSDGVMYLIRHGEEHAGNAFAVRNWRHLPGTTCEQAEGPFPWQDRYAIFYGLTNFACAASDGTYGVAGYDFAKRAGQRDDDPPTVAAQKAWFCFDDEIVCLGAGIAGYRDFPIHTTLNHCRLMGNIEAGWNRGRRETFGLGNHKALDTPGWVLHDGIGYVLPLPDRVHVSAERMSGSMRNLYEFGLEDVLHEDMFCLWIDHGIRPNGADYVYVAVPGVDAAALAAYAAQPAVRILSNTPSLQAVRHDVLGVSGAVFYEPGRVRLTPKLEIAVDRPCVALIREGSDRLAFSVSSPDTAPSDIHLRANSTPVRVVLPGGEYAGKPVPCEIERNP